MFGCKTLFLIILGCISGRITQVFLGDDGEIYQKGGWRIIIFLVLVIPIRLLFRYTLAIQPVNEILQIITLSYIIMLSVQITARNLVIMSKIPKLVQVIRE